MMKQNTKKSLFFALGFTFAILALNAKEQNGETNDTKYISPNSDGVKDTLEIPLSINDASKVSSWKLVINDENGKTVRTVENKISFTKKTSFKDFLKQLFSTKKDIDIPKTLVWNGNADSGEVVSDGSYTYYVEAVDENGNRGRTKNFTVIVDTTPPVISLEEKSEAEKVFGAGEKTAFNIKQSGSEEELWQGIITNSAGKTVKTFTFKNAAPSSVLWDGTNDEGKLAANGVYFYEISATDKAGNKSAESKISNIIFSAEKIKAELKTKNMYFSPDKEPLTLSILLQKPSTLNPITSWKLDILNEEGKIVRSYKEVRNDDKSSAILPESVAFDGKDNSKSLLPDGPYKAVFEATYLNGYVSEKSFSPNFVLDRTIPKKSITASEKVFGGASKQTQLFTISEKEGSKLAPITERQAFIIDENGKIIKTYNITDALPEKIEWTGLTDEGKTAPNGRYSFVIKEKDAAGNFGESALSSPFTFDTKDALLVLHANEKYFSPNGDGVKDSVSFIPQVNDAKSIASYSFKIQDEQGKIHMEESGENLPKEFVWKAKNKDAKEGIYTAKCDITMNNGSFSHAESEKVILDLTPPSAEFSFSSLLFSPDKDGKRDALELSVNSCTNETLWKAAIKDESGKTIKKFAWNGTIKTSGKNAFVWDGSDEAGNLARSGNYSIFIESTDGSGNSFAKKIEGITLDARVPKAFITLSEKGFSPNSDGILDTLEINVKSNLNEGIENWKIEIKDEKGAAVKSWSGKSALPQKIIFDGKGTDKKVLNGVYTAVLSATYEKGNSLKEESASFFCTDKAPELTVKIKPEFFSPDNDGVDDELLIDIKAKSAAPIKNWSFTIEEPTKADGSKGSLFWKTQGKSSVPETLVWDGRSNVLKGSDGKAECVESAMDYPYTLTVTDALGMSTTETGLIMVDILVIRVGDVLKMAVPSIEFRANAADFKTKNEVAGGLEPKVAERNTFILKRISKMLKKFPDYTVTVTGHANRVTNDPLEETEDGYWGAALIPLSEARAEFVKKFLEKHGVKASRLLVKGKGGTEPVVSPADKSRNWKNRRVEFILDKKDK